MGAESFGLRGRVGIALGSGAARGLAHIGVIRELRRVGIEPEVVCGTSMGAIVGAVFAAEQLDEFEGWALGLDWRQLVGYVDLTLRGGLIRARRLFEFFEESLPQRRIEELGRPFATLATDLANGQEVWLREGDLLEALRATVALPGLITPSKWDGRWMVDGGLVNPVPVSLCRALGADSVIAVDLNTNLLGRRFGERRGGHAAGPPGGESGLLGALGNGSFLGELAEEIRSRFGSDEDGAESVPNIYSVMANSVNIMQVRIARSRMAGDPPELLVTPRMHDFGIMDFDRADEAIAEGAHAVRRALDSARAELA